MKFQLYLGTLAILAASLCGCGEKAASEQKSAASAGPAVSVVVAPVQQKTVPVYIELTARTDASDSVDIRARVRAYLQQQHFQEGTFVKKGQPLFTLDKREYEAQLMQAKAQLAKGEADLEEAKQRSQVQTAEAELEIAMAQLNKADQDVNRLKPLALQQAVPQQDYDDALAAQRGYRAQVDGKKAALNTSKVTQTASIQQATAAVEAGKASVLTAQLNIEYCNITAPIDGIIGIRQVAPGNLVGGAEPTLLTTISNVNPMRVYASISESDYLKVARLRKEGKLTSRLSELELILSDGSVFSHKGRVIISDRAVDLKTGTLTMVGEFANPDMLLRPGQFGRIRVAAQTVENALLVPQKAVTEMQSAKVVYVVNADNKVQLRSVTLGERVGQDYIVTEGVKAGERIITEGLLKVRPGATVTPTDKPATTETGAEKKGD